MTAIDLNCDLGEIPALATDGTDDAMLGIVTSVNVACGGHAGDAASMERTIRSAMRRRVAIGAHPSYPDREGFGRRATTAEPSAIEAFVASQVRALLAVAESCGAAVGHVKPHGALYHAAGADEGVAAAIGRATRAVRRDLVLVGMAGSRALDVWGSLGISVVGEAFADRRYSAGGSLLPRTRPDAVITSPEEAAAQASRVATGRGAIAVGGEVVAIVADSLCVHGDTPGAVAIAAAVRARLEADGVALRAIIRPC